jgi:hypothetical protein
LCFKATVSVAFNLHRNRNSSAGHLTGGSNSFMLNEMKISLAPTAAPAAAPTADTYAERAVREASERAEKRRLELAQQRSADNPPGIRIRVWEKVHALRLPRDPEHPILYVIATGTGLTLAQVREEQRTRFPEQALAPGCAAGSE